MLRLLRRRRQTRWPWPGTANVPILANNRQHDGLGGYAFTQLGAFTFTIQHVFHSLSAHPGTGSQHGVSPLLKYQSRGPAAKRAVGRGMESPARQWSHAGKLHLSGPINVHYAPGAGSLILEFENAELVAVLLSRVST